MQYWARRLEQEIDGVMRIFGGVQQLRGVSCLSFICAAFLVAVNVPIAEITPVSTRGVSRSQLAPRAGAWLAVLLLALLCHALSRRVGVCVACICLLLQGCMSLLPEHVPMFLYGMLNASQIQPSLQD